MNSRGGRLNPPDTRPKPNGVAPCAVGLRILARIIARHYAAKLPKTGKDDADDDGERKGSSPR